MITTPTMLILGAGASMPFRFPSGVQLAEKICGFASPGSAEMVQLGFTEQGVRCFLNDFQACGNDSIDEFLEGRTDYIHIGKILIARFLIQCEVIDRIRQFEDNWYRLLLKRMRAPSLKEFSQNKLTIATFNYDRSLETFLFDALQSQFKDASDSEIAEALGAIPIIHLHGQLGFLPWQPRPSMKDNRYRSYSTEITAETLKTAADGIQIVHEVKDYQPFLRAYDRMLDAEIIYFLGFGYGKTNIDRLFLRDGHMLPGPGGRVTGKLFGTSFGLTEPECQHIRIMQFGGDIQFSANTIVPFLRNNDEFQAL